MVMPKKWWVYDPEADKESDTYDVAWRIKNWTENCMHSKAIEALKRNPTHLCVAPLVVGSLVKQICADDNFVYEMAWENKWMGMVVTPDASLSQGQWYYKCSMSYQAL